MSEDIIVMYTYLYIFNWCTSKNRDMAMVECVEGRSILESSNKCNDQIRPTIWPGHLQHEPKHKMHNSYCY